MHEIDDDECGICMDNPVRVRLECLHTLCQTCYDGLKAQPPSACPFCRRTPLPECVPILPRVRSMPAMRVVSSHSRVPSHSRVHSHRRRHSSSSTSSTSATLPSIDERASELHTLIRHGCRQSVAQAMRCVRDCAAVAAMPGANGNTALHVAAQNGKLSIAKWLLGMGVDVNRQNATGQTPLHYAVAYQYGHLVSYLVNAGASETIRNAHGLTCYQGLSPNK